MSLDIGEVLNKRYRITEVLGLGGMASVYRAIDENLSVEVAVKENLFTTEDYARQFKREATILATLRHPNLPRVTDHFVIEGQGQYLVMDYIEGEDLRQRMDRKGVLIEDEALVLGIAICDALIYLHSRDPVVLHRDIKPGNVRITAAGQVYLVDFGLAKLVKPGDHTDTGARAMTPGYSPPEQYGTSHTDSRSDIFSLGATLYAALTNNLPEDALARLMGQAQLTPLRARNRSISLRLEEILHQALQVHPEDRFQTAGEMRQALLECWITAGRKEPDGLALSIPIAAGAAGSENGGPAQPGGPVSPASGPGYPPSGGKRLPFLRRANQNVTRGIGLVMLLLGLTGVLFLALTLLNSNQQPLAPIFTATPTSRSTAKPVSFVEKPTATGLAPTATLPPTVTPTSRPTTSPTPRQSQAPSATALATPVGGGSGEIAFTSDRSGVPQIWLSDMNGEKLRQLTEIPEGACQPDWSPDGKRLVFISPCTGDFDTYRNSNMYLINTDGSGFVSLGSVPGGDFDPTWSPNGETIAFTSIREGIYGIYLYHLADNTVTSLSDPEGRQMFNPDWSPDGKRIAFLGPSNQIWSMKADGTDWILISRPMNTYLNGHPDWSPDGKFVVFTQWSEGKRGAPWLAMVEYKTSAITAVIAKGTPMGEAVFSPDGKWLLYTGWEQSQFRHLFLMMTNGINRQQVTFGEANEFDPDWRPAVPISGH